MLRLCPMKFLKGTLWKIVRLNLNNKLKALSDKILSAIWKCGRKFNFICQLNSATVHNPNLLT